MLNKTTHLPFALASALMLALASPASLAGNAMMIVPATDSNVPRGDQIPLRRIQQIEQRVDELGAAAAAPAAEARLPAAPRGQASTSH